MLGLQRLLYGPLRPIEIEQLYEKAWFAITETCLAMTIFREEVGGWFLVMFVSLLVGKVWGWIGEGRVDILEQQPPANPRLFHTRLSISLILSASFDLYMLKYSVQTVLRQARPNMMVMFAFEFAVLAVTSMSTSARYVISLHEAAVIKGQTKIRLEERRAQMRLQREETRGQAQQSTNTTTTDTSDTNIDGELDDLDVDVPGWEGKGRWVFYLDLATGKTYLLEKMSTVLADQCAIDFCKLVLYLTFFFVLCIFYGMPIHIIRDVLLTIRSFYKRITDFLRYRHATRDMNDRYPDANAEEIATADVCIICRENMRPWRPVNERNNPAQNGTRLDLEAPGNIDERLRPKRLPCGHILHFACLRSWLERQQNCPTCRRSVLVPSPVTSASVRQNGDQQARARHHNPGNGGLPFQEGVQQPPVVAPNRVRMFNFGPFRLGFGAGQGLAQQLNNEQIPQQQGPGAAGENVQRIGIGFGFGHQPQRPSVTHSSSLPIQTQLQSIEQQLMQELNTLRAQADQLYMVRALQGELARLRIAQANPAASTLGNTPSMYQQILSTGPGNHMPLSSTIHTFGTSQQLRPLEAGHQGVPPGLEIPEGWTLLPLQRLPNATIPGPIGSATQIPQYNNRARNDVDSNANQSVAQSNPLHPNSRSQVEHVTAPVASVPDSNLSSMQPSTAFHSTPIPEVGVRGPIKQKVESSGDGQLETFHAQEELGTNGSGSDADATKSSPTSPSIPPPGLVVPQWASTPGRAGSQLIGDDDAPSNSTTSQDADIPEATLTSSAERREAKGKGRAVTVEDFAGDID